MLQLYGTSKNISWVMSFSAHDFLMTLNSTKARFLTRPFEAPQNFPHLLPPGHHLPSPGPLHSLVFHDLNTPPPVIHMAHSKSLLKCPLLRGTSADHSHSGYVSPQVHTSYPALSWLIYLHSAGHHIFDLFCLFPIYRQCKACSMRAGRVHFVH